MPVLQQQQGSEGPTLSQEGRCVGVTGEQLGQGLSLQPEKAQEGDQGWLPAPGRITTSTDLRKHTQGKK